MVFKGGEIILLEIKDWQEIIRLLPDIFKDVFYETFDNTFKICSKCNNEYPKHKLFFSIHNQTKDGFHHCKECKSGLFTRILENDIKSVFKAFRNIFEKDIDYEKYKFCHSCLKLLPKNKETFSLNNSDCRECSGIQLMESLYAENLKLGKLGLKKCRFCLEIKCISNFKKMNDGRILVNCDDCELEAKLEKSEYDQEYLILNSECKKEYYQNWKESGGQLIRQQHAQKRKSIKNNVLSDFTTSQWLECLKYFEDSCAYCGMTQDEHLIMYGHSIHQDHVVPVKKNGEYTKSNIIPSCGRCNQKKKTKDLPVFFQNNSFFTLERYLKIIDYLLIVT